MIFIITVVNVIMGFTEVYLVVFISSYTVRGFFRFWGFIGIYRFIAYVDSWAVLMISKLKVLALFCFYRGFDFFPNINIPYWLYVKVYAVIYISPNFIFGAYISHRLGDSCIAKLKRIGEE